MNNQSTSPTSALNEFNRHADIKRLQFILSSIRKHIGTTGTVLDVGCGNGVISRYIGENGFTVLGIDVSDKTIESARKANKLSNVRFEVLSAESLVADGKQYDAVICSEVLEHLTEPNKLLKTLQDVVSEKGILIVTVPNGKGPRESLVTKPVIRMQQKQNFSWKAVNKMKKWLGYSGTTTQSSADDLQHIQFFTKKDLQAMAAANGFRIISFAHSNFIDDIFPVSIISRKSKLVQQADSKMADILPHYFAGGFFTVWKKQQS